MDDIVVTPPAGGEPGLSTDGAAPAPASDPFDTETNTQFDRAYVTKLREEAARHRTEAAAAKKNTERYQSVFSAWGDDDADVLLDVLAEAAQDPKAGAARLKEIAAILAGDIQETTTADAGTPKSTAITQEDLDRLLTEREQAASLKQEVARVESEAEALGYKKGSADYFKLLWMTKETHNFDMGAADKAIKAEKEAAVAEYLAKKAADADGGAGAPPAGGAPPSNSEPITNLKQASASARARIAAMRDRA